MSAETSGDLSLIKDEELLRKLWANTEDFGRKKEIRAHMYKLREARLRDFYNSGEVSSEIQNTTKMTTTQSKSCATSTHADSLDDHSFISMKTKEIRDSESPTREENYRVRDKAVLGKGWSVITSNRKSDDGKTFTTTKTATTSGTEDIEGGQLRFSAKNEQQASVYKDGDDNNFTKTVGACSNTLVKQEATGGDEHSTFKSSSMRSSSTSNQVTEHRSSTEVPLSKDLMITTKTYTDNIPSELKTHPSYVEGKTKVTRETKTLPDGSTVTTTRYEIRGGDGSSQTSKTTQSTSTQQTSSSSLKSSQMSNQNQSKNTRYVTEQPSSASSTISKNISDSKDKRSEARDLQSSSVRTVDKQQGFHDSSSKTFDVKTNVIDSSDTTTFQDVKNASERIQASNIQDQASTTKTALRKSVDDSRSRSQAETTVTEQIYNTKDNRQIHDEVTDEFKTKGKQDNQVRTSVPLITCENSTRKPLHHEIERLQSSRADKPEPQECKYDTTVFTNTRISVEVSPTHDAFARSLRAVSPDQLSKSSTTRSNNSLRSSVSPEKIRHASRFSPERRSISLTKTTSNETITNKCKTVNTTTCKSNTSKINSATLTRRSKGVVRSRSPSPTSVASDIEFIRNTAMVTDLDTNETTVITVSRPSSLEITKKTTKRLTDRSPSSPLTDTFSKKTSKVTRTGSLRTMSPTKEASPLKRTDTYEERCRQILGITNQADRRRSSLERSSLRRTTSRTMSGKFESPTKTPLEEFSPQIGTDRKSPTKDGKQIKSSPERQQRKPSINEISTDVSKSTERQLVKLHSSVNDQSKTSELSSQTITSSEEQSNLKQTTKISEFSSQIRRSPEKQRLEQYPEKKASPNEGPKISEFPSQATRSPVKESLEPYPEKKIPLKETPKISEFPSQVRRSPKKEPLEPYPEKKSVLKEGSKVTEFPSQVRKSPEKEPLEPYPVKKTCLKEAPKISEFPSQIRKSPEKEPLEPYPEKKSIPKEGSKVTEFPSQVRKSPEKEPLEPYTVKKTYLKESPKISEFPSQIRKSPDKEPLEPYPENKIPLKEGPKISEFPSQVRRSPEKESLEPYPEKFVPKEGSKLTEFPSQIGKSPEKEPLEPYPERKSVPKEGPKVTEFPSQVRISPEKEPLKTYSEKKHITKERPKISEFPSQVKKPSQRERVEPYPEKESPINESPKVRENKKSQERTLKENKTQRVTKTDQCLVGKKTEIESKIHSASRLKKDTPRSSRDSNNEIQTSVSKLEAKAQVREPLATKKFVSQLCREEEIQKTDLTRKGTESTLNNKIIESTINSNHKTVKKDAPEKGVFSSNRPANVSSTTNKFTSRTTSSIKKPTEKQSTTGRATCTVTLSESPTKSFSDAKPCVKDIKRTSQKISLHDIDHVNQKKEENRVNTRTYGQDRRSKEQITKTTYSSDFSKKVTTKKYEDIKTQRFVDRKQQRIVSKTITEDDNRCVCSDQETPKRHRVVTTITVGARKPKTIKSVISKTTTTYKQTQLASKKPSKVQNGHISSDEESTVDKLEDEIVITMDADKIEGGQESKTFIQGSYRPQNKPEKCITTKSIVINNEANERKVIVNLQRSKSSREPTPDGICPMPVSSDDETTPRYPDQISEPDDCTYHKGNIKKLTDVPILEDVDTEFQRITEIINTSKVDTLGETDITNLSVDKRINNFLSNAEKITKTKLGPAPKVERPKLEVTEDLESDECLLSVSEKVNKFITSTDKLKTPQDLPQRPKSPKCLYYPDDDVNVSDKIAHFITAAKIVTTQQEPSLNLKEVDDLVKERELSVSDKVSKFTHAKDSKLTVSLEQLDGKCSEKIQKKETTPERKPFKPSIKTAKQTNEYFQHESSNNQSECTLKSTRRPSDDKVALSLTRGPSDDKIPFSQTRRPSDDKIALSQGRRPSHDRTDPTQSRRPSDDRTVLSQTRRLSDDNTVLSQTSRLRSTECIKKAKALFENFDQTQEEAHKQHTILSRPFDTEGKSLNKTVKSHTQTEATEKVADTTWRRSQSPECELPGYMKPLDRSLRPNSPHRNTVNQMNQINKRKNEDVSAIRTSEDNASVHQTKFGVTLKRTDSGRHAPLPTLPKTQLTSQEETNIEEIYDLKILEQLLEAEHDYDKRRKIRAQIRLVKKLLSEGKTTENVKSTKIAEASRTTECSKARHHTQSSETKPTRTRSPETKQHKVADREKTPDNSTKTINVFQTQLKKTSPSSKSTPTDDSTPEWVKQRNLKKTSNTSVINTRTVNIKKSRSSPVKVTKPTDVITSSYGVGPTDESGSPLFGLKALRVRSETDATKIQRTDQNGSGDGQELIGDLERSELGTTEELTQKSSYKNTSSLKSSTISKKTKDAENVEKTETKTTRLNRRGSVKVLSQKFIDSEAETLKSERQSSYPKAGLILRTSSFKESASSGESREGSSERSLTVKSSTTRTVSGGTFLSSHSKVTGVQDVINRMKSTDVCEGDTAEDVEARSILNKFLGSQVILSGIESNVKASTANTRRNTKVTTTITEGGKPVTKTRVYQTPITDKDLQEVWNEQTLRLLLEQSTNYDERKTIRARLRQIMAEQEACTELVERASQDQVGTTIEEASEATHTKTTFVEGADIMSQVTTRVSSTQQIKANKPMSPFAKFRQLDRQNSNTSPSTPKTPLGSGPLFKFTDPAVSQSASTIKDRLLHWCRTKTKEYENIQLDNFSTSWADGLAFCALVHHFLPEAFDYHALSSKNRRYNFTLAFQVADEKADIAPLLDVDDMVATRKPDWKCVFTYVQSIYRRFKDED